MKTGKFLEAHGPVSLVCIATNVKEILFYYTQGWTLTTCTVARAYIPMCEHTHTRTHIQLKEKSVHTNSPPQSERLALPTQCTYRRKHLTLYLESCAMDFKNNWPFQVATMLRTQWQNVNQEMLWQNLLTRRDTNPAKRQLLK